MIRGSPATSGCEGIIECDLTAIPCSTGESRREKDKIGLHSPCFTHQIFAAFGNNLQTAYPAGMSSWLILSVILLPLAPKVSKKWKKIQALPVLV